MKKYAICLIFCLVFAGCCNKEVVVLVPDEKGHVGKIEVQGEKGAVIIAEPWQSTTVSSMGKPGKIQKISPKKVEELFGKALDADISPPLDYLFYFASGTARIANESMEQVPAMVKAILARENYEITIIGHTDRTGTEASNLRLSKKRTRTVKDLLMSHGIPEAKLRDIEHYGESMPVVPTADGVAEEKNRRVEVFVR